MIESTPKFISGVFPFTGAGYDKTALLDSGLTYTVPADKRSQLIFFRVGNSSAEMIYLVLTKDGKPMRLFPIGAKSSEHVSLAVVEDLLPESKLDVLVGAPQGVSGTVVLDIGLVEV